MRRLVPLVLLLAPLAARAQPGPIEDPTVLFATLGKPWATVGPTLPAPAFGALTDGSGDLGWESTEDGVRSVWVGIEAGTIVRLEVEIEGDADLGPAEIDVEMRARVGVPGPDGFFRWEQLQDFFEYAYEGPMPAPLEMAVDVPRSRIRFRLAPPSAP